MNFKENGGPLEVNFVFEGPIVASYYYNLYKKDSNDTAQEGPGNNQNTQDDRYYLPLPENDNNGRIIELNTSFYTTATAGNYKITIELYQSGVKIDEHFEEAAVTGGKQTSLLMAKLNMIP